MSCSKCCRFKPFFGKVDYVIRDYDPTEDFTDYIVPTWWINRKRKVAWFLVSKEGGKSLWVPLQFGVFIQKILTKCGEILPENGQIEFKEGEGIVFACDGSKLTFSLEIPILAEYGGTGFTEYKLGDLLVGNLDGTLSKLAIGEKGKALGVKEDGTLGYIDIVQKLNCSEDAVTENALTRWNEDGKCLKDSKTVQDDIGNTMTNVIANDGVTDTTRNRSNFSTADAIKEVFAAEFGGKPMYRWTKNNKQIFEAYIDRDDSSFKIEGKNLQDPTQVGNFFKIDRKGNVTRPSQISCFGIMEKRLANQHPNSEYVMGTQQAFTIIDNEGGYFYPGDGNGKPASFTFTVKAKFLVYMSMLVYRSVPPDNQMELVGKVNVNRNGNIVSSGSVFNIPDTFGKQSVIITTGVKSNVGDILTWSIYGRSNPWYIDFYDFQGQQAKYTNYVGVYCLG